MNYHTFFDLDSIPSPKTRKLFKEVLSSYVNENYRSAIVMLYSVTICDLFYKLIDLRDVYGDKAATEILEEASKLSDEATRKTWERSLIAQIQERTSLLSQESRAAIEHLHQLRNFTAHPTFNPSTYELLVPSKEETIACMKEMLHHVLLQPCYFGRYVIDTMLEDLDRFREAFVQDYERWKEFLNRKYYSHVLTERIAPWFSSLWSLCFKKPDDERCNRNRMPLGYALRVLLDGRKEECIAALTKDVDRYGVDPSKVTVRSAIDVLTFHPDLFEHLNNETKAIVQAGAQKDINMSALAFFLSHSLSEHMAMLDRHMEMHRSGQSPIVATVAERLFAVASDNGEKDILLDHYISWYAGSRQFDAADERFDIFIAPFLSQMEKRHYETLLAETNENYQIYGRRNCYRANTEILKYAKGRIECTDIEKRYPNFEYNKSIFEEQST